MKFLNLLSFHFCPPGSQSGFRIRIRIHWPDWIRIQSLVRFGSETLLKRCVYTFLKCRFVDILLLAQKTEFSCAWKLFWTWLTAVKSACLPSLCVVSESAEREAWRVWVIGKERGNSLVICRSTATPPARYKQLSRGPYSLVVQFPLW